MAYDFQISLRAATEGQVKANIMAIGTVTLTIDGVAVVELRDFNVKRTRAADKIFVGSASKSYKNREGEIKWAPLYKVFPQDTGGYNDLIQKIESEYARLGGTPTNTISQNSSPAAPAAQPAMQSQPIADAFPTAGAQQPQITPAAPAVNPPSAQPDMGAPLSNANPSSGMPNPNPASTGGDGWPFS